MIETRKATLPDQTRERILNAAREVIARKGKRGSTTREIADVAGVNEATLFRHFGTKEALIVACAQHFCGAEEFREVGEHLHGPIESDLFQLGKLMMKRMSEIQDMIRWSLVEQDYEESIFSTYAWAPQIAVRESIVEFFKRRAASGELRGDPKNLAMMFMGVVFAHVIAGKKFPDSDLQRDGDAALRFYIDVILNGVRGK